MKQSVLLDAPRTDTFEVAGYTATVHIPAGAHGRWLWKTEFFYAFDEVERVLYDEGFIRVYFAISDKYGSPDATRLMYAFYEEMVARYDISPRACLIGFSRGGLYAFNFALSHPECVERVYLDAPVLDLRSWPRTDPAFGEGYLHEQVMAEYGFADEEAFCTYGRYPVGQLAEYFALGLPTLLVAGDCDSVVAFSENSGVMIDYAAAHDCPLHYYVKVGIDHHPHGFGCRAGIDFTGKPYPTEMVLYGSALPGTEAGHTKVLDNDPRLLVWFFEKD